MKKHLFDKTYIPHKIEQIAFLLAYVIWSIAFFIFEELLFMPLPNRTRIVSVIALISLVTIFVLFGICLSRHFFEKERQLGSIVAQLMLPFGTYNITAHRLSIPLFLVILPATCISVYWIWQTLKRNNEMLIEEIFYRIYTVFRRNMAIAFSIYILCLTICRFNQG